MVSKYAKLFVLAAASVLAATVLGGESPAVVATWRGGSLERADYESWRAFHELDDGLEAVREMVFVESMAALSRQHGVESETRTRLEIEAMRHQVLLSALQSEVLATVTVSDEEVETLRRQDPDVLRRPRKLLLRNIYKHLGDDPAATREHMRELHRQLTEGADFKELARRESESQTRFRDGLVGYLAPEDLPPAVAAAVRGLAPGELSGVVEHADGLSIFLCEEIREARVPAPEEVRTKLRDNLLKQRQRQSWVEFQDRLLAEAKPRLQTSGPVAIEMEGYRLSAEDLAELVDLKSRGKKPADFDESQLENLLRGWAVGVLGVRRAIHDGLDREPEVAAALRWRHLDILAQRELVRRIDNRLREPDEKEMRSQFETNPRRYSQESAYELAAIHFDAADGEDPRGQVRRAVDVARRLESGELTFADAARRYSVLPSAANGGLVGWQTSRQIAAWGPVAAKALRQLAPGERSGLLRLESGLWIFELRDRRAERPMSFEEAKEKLRQDLRRRHIGELELTVRQEYLDTLDLRLLP